MEDTKKKFTIINPKFSGMSIALALGVGIIVSVGQIHEGIQVANYESGTGGKAKFTLLVYMDGSDLETDYNAATSDLDEIQTALNKLNTSDYNINVVVEAGGCQFWNYEPIEGNTYSRFSMKANEEPQVEFLEKRNMGRSDTLTDFINYGTQTYPAEHYGLIFWNHGSGPIYGFGNDQNFDGDSLTLNEIKIAFDESVFKDAFDFVAFDACLMSSYELVSMMNQHTDYLISSQDLEPQDGYDYGWIADVKYADDDSNYSYGYNVASSILKYYDDFYIAQGNKATLSMIDMSKYENFENELNACLKKIDIKSNQDFCRLMQQQRTNIRGFGMQDPMDIPEIVDLKLFMTMALGVSGNEEMIQNFQNSYDELVVKTVVVGTDNAFGLSIFLPSDTKVTKAEDFVIYEEMKLAEYQSFVDEYRKYLNKTFNIEWEKPIALNQEIRVNITPESIENIGSVYLQTFIMSEDGSFVYLISSDSDVTIDYSGFLKAKVEPAFWGLKGELLTLIEFMDTDECTQYVAPILYNDTPCNMIINFDFENTDGVITAIVPMKVEKQVYQLNEGDTIVPLYPCEELKASENLEIFYQYNDTNYIRGEKILIEDLDSGDAELEKIRLKRQDCWYAFLIRNTAQNDSYSELIQN